jgi:beta-lactamase superfamily II metal-dependent hydrolase
MKVRMNKAANGDCFLVQTRLSNLLIDGGTASSYKGWSESLANISLIDALFITHIDSDHTNGIIKLLDDKAYKDIHISNVFFNGVKQITQMDTELVCDYDADYDAITSNFSQVENAEVNIGFSEGTSLSYLIEKKGFSINNINSLKAIHQGSFNEPIKIKDISIQILGPSLKSLNKLKLLWLDILEERGIHKKIITRKHAKAFESFVNSLSQTQDEETNISSNNTFCIDELCAMEYERDSSLSNETSFSFIIRNNDKSILMLGDAHVETIIEWMDSNQIEILHIDAIKVSHHGSRHNINADFIKRVVCNNYLISTNGKKHHPDLETLAIISKYSSKPNTNIYINYEIEDIPNSFIKSLSDLPNPAFIHFDNEEITI